MAESDALLVVGSSLMVYSGFRFCRLAAELGKPIALVNQGITRADDLATSKLESDCGALLAAVATGTSRFQGFSTGADATATIINANGIDRVFHLINGSAAFGVSRPL